MMASTASPPAHALRDSEHARDRAHRRYSAVVDVSGDLIEDKESAMRVVMARH